MGLVFCRFRTRMQAPWVINDNKQEGHDEVEKAE
jgi:hypothetical protein